MSKKASLFLLSFTLMICLFLNPGGIFDFLVNTNPLKNVRTYRVYYDSLNPEIIEVPCFAKIFPVT